MIQVDYLVLADAVATAEGKQYIHGAGWDTIMAANFPVTHHALAVAGRLRVPWTDTNHPIRLQVDVVDADGQSLMPRPPGPLAATITVGRPPNLAPGQDQVYPFSFEILDLRFERPGTYVVVVILEGSSDVRAPFHVDSR